MVSTARKKSLQSKINAIRTRLAEFREYKRVIAAEGGRPDEGDKERESKLIRMLLKHEKEIGPAATAKAAAAKPEAKRPRSTFSKKR